MELVPLDDKDATRVSKSNINFQKIDSPKLETITTDPPISDDNVIDFYFEMESANNPISQLEKESSL